MSSLVDKCKSEMAKLRQKGQTLFSNNGSGESSPNAEGNQEQIKDGRSPGSGSAFGRVMRVKPPLYSDASVFMIVECFSP